MKARLQNRQGPPLLQVYYDLAKLLRKEPIRSETASWVYVAGPRVYFAAAIAATTLVPVLLAAAPLESAGGILLLVGTLALVLIRTRARHAGWVAAAFVSFGIAWFCRIADTWRPPLLPMGTHWLWHTFGALTTFTLAEYVFLIERVNLRRPVPGVI